jgi:hypothetical protein
MYELKSLEPVSVEKIKFEGVIKLNSFNEAKQDKSISDLQQSEMFFISKPKINNLKVINNSKRTSTIYEEEIQERIVDLCEERNKIRKRIDEIELIISNASTKLIYNYKKDLISLKSDLEIINWKIRKDVSVLNDLRCDC